MQVMVPHNYQLFTSTMKDLHASGRITTALIDQAVTRILTAKFALGLFEKPYAPDRSSLDVFRSPGHLKVAQEAVSQSLVLLKNDPPTGSSEPVLPIDTSSLSKIVVAGKSRDNIGYQCGGWTIEWQGFSGNSIPGTSVLQAIQDEVSGTGITVEDKGDRASGQFSGDLGLVFVGEKPYTEGVGDDLDLQLDNTDKAAIQNVCSKMACVVVLISGRPMIINNQLAQADAFVTAWLPGTEGAGITDVLFGHKDFCGTLPMTWPSDISQVPINVGDGKQGLFNYGYGITFDGTAASCSVP